MGGAREEIGSGAERSKDVDPEEGSERRNATGATEGRGGKGR